MGAAKLLQRRAGTIRRVVRVSGQFVCGLCRNPYVDLHEARGCLEQCWERVLELDPVVEKKMHGQHAHRCRFCARDYENREMAQQCANECKSLYERKANAEARVAGSDEQVQVKRPSARKMVKQVVMPMAPARRKSAAQQPTPEPVLKKPEAVASTLKRPDAPKDDLGEESIVDQSVQAGKPEKKKKPADVFYRDGARYVCNVCHEKYFTKSEVTNCYEAHE